MQEDEIKALGGGEDVPSAGEEQPDSEDESGSSSDSGVFGFMAQQPKSKKKPVPGNPKPPSKRRRKGDEPEPKDVKAKATANAKAEESLEKTIAKVKSCTDFFDGVKALSIWNGSLKRKDLDSKIAKSLDLVRELNSAGTKQAQAHAATLNTRTEFIGQIAETLLILQGKVDALKAAGGDCKDHLTMPKEKLKHFAGMLPDCVNAVLTEFGRRLTEARS